MKPTRNVPGAGEGAAPDSVQDAVDAVPPVVVEAAADLEQPATGGSYIRQADGTLVKQEG